MAPKLYNDLRLSPDGSRVAVAQATSGVADIWVYTFARGTYTRLTFTGVNATPVWSADGRDIFFSAIDRERTRQHDLPDQRRRRPRAGAGRDAPRLRLYLKHVSADANWALVDYIGFAGARANVGRLELKPGAKVEPIVATRSDEYVGGAVARTGRWSPTSPTRTAGRKSTSARSRRRRAAGRSRTPAARSRCGRRTAKSIYYRTEGRLMRVPVIALEPFQAGLPALLFDGVYNLRSDTGVSYQPHPDGTRLLMTRAADVMSSGSVRVMTRWFDELRKIK